MTFPKVDLRGAGGKEKEMAKLFPNLTRESGPLHDFVDPITNQRFEIKKTQFQRLQSWIDPTKYIDLTEDDRNIIFRFVWFNNATGECLEIVDTTLGEVVDRFVSADVLDHARELVKIYPKRSQFQFKLSIHWR